MIGLGGGKWVGSGEHVRVGLTQIDIIVKLSS